MAAAVMLGFTHTAPRARPDIVVPETARTLPGLFRARASRTPDACAYTQFERERDRWVTYTWSEMSQRLERWTSALAGDALEPGERVAIMLPNSCEWVLFDQAALALGLVVVPLYVNDRADNSAYILSDCGARVFLCESIEQWQRLAAHADELPELSRVIVRSGTAHGDARVIGLEEWLTRGRAPPERPELDPDALATIVYTSGTAGRPKGVMLSHGNILWNAHAGVRQAAVYPEEVMLSFLPLSHTLERTIGYYLPIMAGLTVAYARSVQQLAEDLTVIRPHLIVTVPRIFERVRNRLNEQLAGRPPVARRLFDGAVDVGWRRFLHGQGRAPWHPRLALWPIYRRLVARKVTSRLGGRLRLAICGGAPLPFEVARLFIALGVPILQGYGLTETSPVISVNTEDDNDPASVGRPLPGCEVDITPEGELVARSPGVMLGYWRNEALTREMIDEQGWLHTGDKARIEAGRIYITGRLKDIIVLATGEKVPPADMEQAIVSDPLFDQVAVIGDGRPYLSAITVLNPEQWRRASAGLDLDPDDPAATRAPSVERHVLERINASLHDFPGHAQVYRAAAVLEPWTTENGLLTPTLKLRREALVERYTDEIERMYEGH